LAGFFDTNPSQFHYGGGWQGASLFWAPSKLTGEHVDAFWPRIVRCMEYTLHCEKSHKQFRRSSDAHPRKSWGAICQCDCRDVETMRGEVCFSSHFERNADFLHNFVRILGQPRSGKMILLAEPSKSIWHRKWHRQLPSMRFARALAIMLSRMGIDCCVTRYS
jgi:hypothetical protein